MMFPISTWDCERSAAPQITTVSTSPGQPAAADTQVRYVFRRGIVENDPKYCNAGSNRKASLCGEFVKAGSEARG